MYKKLDENPRDSPFYDFVSARYAISARVNVKKAWNYSKKNDKSFYLVCLYCLLSGLNDVSELKRRIINDESVEFDKIDGVTPVMNKDKTVFKELLVEPVGDGQTFDEWYDIVVDKKDKTLDGTLEGYNVGTLERDFEPIANFSCIPWIDFDTMTNCVCQQRQIMPVITWGKVNDDMEMSVSITVNHIFVFGQHIAKFFERIQDYLNSF